ncbi:MAG: chitobiase/beta-hexosaminidase C-terminal domain-containing protein, partial [Planctomycetes bacterium]|nr:chitobiase/beta-hexosaminidase C-terminal domain-containing protein [Planctomycetota bacterium]
SVKMLVGDSVLSFTQQGPALTIELPSMLVRPELDTVVVVEVQGPPVVFRAPTITCGWPEFVTGTTATISAGTGLVARYTTDGGMPTADSPMADGPIAIETTCELRAATFRDGDRVSEVVSQRFTAVAPWPACEPVPKAAGLMREIVAGVAWEAIPADAERQVLADRRGAVPTVTCGDAPGEHVAQRLSGFLEVPNDELYRFALRSDDGSRLWLDGRLVVDNDGLHGTVEKTGAAPLAQGLHAITVVWFNKTGGYELGLKWATGGGALVEVPTAALRH